MTRYTYICMTIQTNVYVYVYRKNYIRLAYSMALGTSMVTITRNDLGPHYDDSKCTLECNGNI